MARGEGWQHGDVPPPPSGLLKTSREAWATWMGSWFAWFWAPEDVPALRQVVRLYDAVERGELQRANEMRLQMDAYGITPKGQQDRRWMQSSMLVVEAAPDDAAAPMMPPIEDDYPGLRLVASDA